MQKSLVTFISTFLLSTLLFADVEMVRYSSSGDRGINVFKGLVAIPKPSKTTLPKLEIGLYAKANQFKKSYLTCETRSGQKFSEGDFGYAGCLGEKKDQAKVQGVAPPLASGTVPTLQDLRVNLDHTFNF